MIEQISEWIVKRQMRYPKMFLLAFLILAVLFIPGIFRLVGNVEPSLEKVLPQDIEEVKVMNDMRSQFGADMIYLLVYAESPVYDIRNPDFLEYVDSLSQKIRTHDHILGVTNLADMTKQDGEIPGSLQEVKNSIENNPFVFQYTSRDYDFTVIRVRSDTGASAEIIREVVDSIRNDIETMEGQNPGASVKLTGFNAIDMATFKVIMSDFAFITLISLILVSIVVFITFKSLARGMLPMIVVMNALVWTMGITGYLNLTITVVSMVAAAMIMGLGIDFGIHIVHGFFEKRKKMKREEALTETMRELFRATLGASLTTIAGFLALLFGVLPAMKILGIILAIGIFTTLIGAVFLLPVVVFQYDRWRRSE